MDIREVVGNLGKVLKHDTFLWIALCIFNFRRLSRVLFRSTTRECYDKHTILVLRLCQAISSKSKCPIRVFPLRFPDIPYRLPVVHILDPYLKDAFVKMNTYFHKMLVPYILYANMQRSEARLNIEISSYQYKDSHYKDKTVSRPFYLYNENPIHEKTVFVLRRGPDLERYHHIFFAFLCLYLLKQLVQFLMLFGISCYFDPTRFKYVTWLRMGAATWIMTFRIHQLCVSRVFLIWTSSITVTS